MRAWALPLVALPLLLAACPADDAYSLIIDLRTDYASGDDFDSVQTSIVGDPLGAETLVAGPEHLATTSGDAARFNVGARLIEHRGIDGGLMAVDVVLLRAGEPVARRRTLVELDRDVALTIFVASSCATVTCPPADSPDRTACHGGRCVDPRCSSLAPELCGEGCRGADDCAAQSGPCGPGRCVAGECVQATCLPDGGPADAAPDAPPSRCPCDDQNPCTMDVCEAELCRYEAVEGMCDDGNLCTRDDRCEAGACVGTETSCAGGADCVGCNPATGECEAGQARDGVQCGVRRMRCCQGRCVDTASDAANCGGCGLACSLPPICTAVDGSGRCSCVGPGDCPGGAALNTCNATTCACQSDEACAADQTCEPGALASQVCRYE